MILIFRVGLFFRLNADFEDMPPEPNEAVKRLTRLERTTRLIA